MRFLPLTLLAAILALGATHSIGHAQDADAESAEFRAARVRARRDLELAKMELRHYWQVEYPREQRRLNAAITLTEAEIRDYRARLRAYGPYDRFSRGGPFLVTLQELRMCLREAELRLRDLWAERTSLARYHSDQWRVLEMNVHEVRLRVAELEADAADDESAVEETVADDSPRVATRR